jgi:hypothetical protein
MSRAATRLKTHVQRTIRAARDVRPTAQAAAHNEIENTTDETREGSGR